MPAGWPPASPKTSTQAGRPPTTQRRLPHASANRATAPAARQHQSNGSAGRTVSPGGCQCRSGQRCSHRNASCTTTPTARQHRRAAAPVGRQYQSGRKTHPKAFSGLPPSFEDPVRGHSLKCVGLNRIPPSRPVFQKPVSCGFLPPFPWSTQRPLNKPHTFYLATPFRPLQSSPRSPFKPRNQALAR